jgi:hypothetical protein
MLADLNSARPLSIVHDLGWQSPDGTRLALPPHAVPRTVYTCFGTILYADREAGRVRHGPPSKAPANLFLIQIDDVAVLATAQEDGGYTAVRIRPEGPRASGDPWAPWFGGGFARVFTMFDIGNEERCLFALQGAGLFACAEASGEFTLSRTEPAEWECFHFAQDGT